MKTQIIKIIPCLVAGFILSACVGAVNLAEGAVENIKNNTKEEPIVDDKDPEPIVVDPEVALINRCTTKDLASDASCAPIVADHPCIEDPFGGACDITFTDYYKTAQANRISFCRENPTHNLCVSAVKNVCTDNPLDADLCFNDNTYHKTHESMCESEPTAPRCQTTVSRICKGDVFHGFCDDNPTYEPARIADCITAGNAGEARCTGAFTAEHCALNPFGAGCDTQSYLTEARTNRVKFCDDNVEAGNNLCPQVVRDCLLNPYGTDCGTHFDYKKLPTAASWLQSLDSPLPKFPNAVNPKNEFLQGTETGFYFGSARTLTFADLDDDSMDSMDGVAFLNYRNNYYAGILSGTDLGAPRTEKEGTANWNGIFVANGNYVSNGYSRVLRANRLPIDTSVYIRNYILTINFGAGEQAGTISGSASYYSLTGSFDSSGIITGTVERSVRNIEGNTDRKSGILTGLIGQEGAVGAFISENRWGYSGGFVARPPE